MNRKFLINKLTNLGNAITLNFKIFLTGESSFRDLEK